MHKRLRYFRESLGLSRQEFGYRIGVSGDVINNIERNRKQREVPEQLINLICTIYNVNKEWLLTGEGEMMRPKGSGLIDQVQRTFNLSDESIVFINKFLQLDEESRQNLLKTFDVLKQLL